MNIPKAIGFIHMQQETGEKRLYLPEFIQYLEDIRAEIDGEVDG